MATETTRLKLCSKDDVSPGSALKIETGGLALAVFNIGDDFFVIDDACTHGPGSLSEGYIDGYTVECDFHQGSFDIRTGAPVLPPCIIPVKTYKVIVEDGVVSIDL